MQERVIVNTRAPTHNSLSCKPLHAANGRLLPRLCLKHLDGSQPEAVLRVRQRPLRLQEPGRSKSKVSNAMAEAMLEMGSARTPHCVQHFVRCTSLFSCTCVHSTLLKHATCCSLGGCQKCYVQMPVPLLWTLSLPPLPPEELV